jgi:bis(5'-nucleosyl)-tetraphosphatase (symmetrical)
LIFCSDKTQKTIPFCPLSQNLAHEVEEALQKDAIEFFKNIYGNEPNSWNDELTGWERLRYITNALTRMRFCSASGKLNLTLKETAVSSNPNLLPWFSIEERKTIQDKIIFGHWSALQGRTNNPYAIALDTGCSWGNSLTALRLSDNQRFSVPARK